jgi:hypothetical protein
MTRADKINGITDNPLLYGNIWSQSLMENHARGNAINAAIRASH